MSEDKAWAGKVSFGILSILVALYLLAGIKFREIGLQLDYPYFTLVPTSNRLEFVGIATSGILTFVLIFIYRNIGNIQEAQKDQMEEQKDLQKDVNDLYERQTDILDRQESWMRAEQTPILSVNSWDADGESIIFNISNVGNGVAKDLNCQITIFPLKDNWPISKEEIELRSGLREQHNIRAAQPKIEPTKYTGEPGSEYSTDAVGLTELANQYSGKRIHIGYAVSIEYHDIPGEKQTNEIWAGESFIDDSDMVLEGVINNTFEVLSGTPNVPPDSFHESDD